MPQHEANESPSKAHLLSFLSSYISLLSICSCFVFSSSLSLFSPLSFSLFLLLSFLHLLFSLLIPPPPPSLSYLIFTYSIYREKWHEMLPSSISKKKGQDIKPPAQPEVPAKPPANPGSKVGSQREKREGRVK